MSEPLTQVGSMTLLPPKPDVCQQCAVDHPEDAPHNQQSLYWQYWFYGQHGRWPTWADAMAHCDPATRQQWKDALAEHGIVVEAAEAPA